MKDKSTIAADIIELVVLNQHAIRAAVEELSLWVSQRGSTTIHDNVLNALQTIDINADGINHLITYLRQGQED